MRCAYEWEIRSRSVRRSRSWSHERANGILAQLLDATEKTRGLNDHETLDIYRIRLLTAPCASPTLQASLRTRACIWLRGERRSHREGMSANVTALQEMNSFQDF